MTDQTFSFLLLAMIMGCISYEILRISILALKEYRKLAHEKRLARFEKRFHESGR